MIVFVVNDSVIHGGGLGGCVQCGGVLYGMGETGRSRADRASYLGPPPSVTLVFGQPYTSIYIYIPSLNKLPACLTERSHTGPRNKLVQQYSSSSYIVGGTRNRLQRRRRRR